MSLSGIKLRNKLLANRSLVGLLLALLSTQMVIRAQQEDRSRQIAELEKRLSTKITKEDIESLLKDASPVTVRRMAENPALKKQQLENLHHLTAMALQALKEKDFVDDGMIIELDDIRVETIARTYDERINKGKSPFSSIGQDRIDAFYAEPANQTKFSQFLKSKTDQAKKDGRLPADKPISETLVQEAKDYFARVRIFEKEAGEKGPDLGAEYQRKSELSVKLQQTQYVAGIYIKTVLAEKIKVPETDVDAYLNAHPELMAAKKAKATEVLLMAKSGKDFAALANEFSDDPGNKDAVGKPQGGIYKDVTKGKMVRPFEQAALALEPGQVSPELVETDFGYHILKLERKGSVKDPSGKQIETYDVRHILISTAVNDPDNPSARPVGAREMVRSKLEDGREKRVMDEVLRNNPVVVPDDFDVPVITDEQLQNALRPQKLPMEAAKAPPPVAAAVTEVLPARVRKYLNTHYRGWKPAPSEYGCGPDVNSGFVRGDFDGDGKRDYAVKFTKGKKGYMLALLRRGNNYRAFVLHNTDSDEMIYSGLMLWKRGELFENSSLKFRLRRDAPADYHCESDVGGIHYYRNGKFVNY
jgi:parvulin-like peptidyl-prolyl isomerase